VRKKLIEATIIVAIEESVRAFMRPLLPYIWLLILALLTWEILQLDPVRDFIVRNVYARLGAKKRMLFYCMVAILGAAVFVSYWWGISKAFSVIETRDTNSGEKKYVAESSSAQTPPSEAGPSPAPLTQPIASPAATAPHSPSRPRSTATPGTVNYAPGGIAISGGTVVNPTINNAQPGRTIENENRQQAVRLLAQYPSRVAVSSIMGSQEALAYAKQWVAVFKAAGWQVEGDGVGSFIPDEQWSGVTIELRGKATKRGEEFTVTNNQAATTLYQALQNTGSNISGHRDPNIPEGVIGVRFGLHP
jgi:hypothetical protein